MLYRIKGSVPQDCLTYRNPVGVWRVGELVIGVGKPAEVL